MALRSSTELVSIIQQNELIIQERAQALGCQSPSIINGWPQVLEVDTKASVAQNEILNATHELNAIVKGARQSLLTPGVNIWASLHCILQLGLVSAVPLDGNDEGRSFEDIAKKSPIPVDTVKRLFKHAATIFIFREEPEGIIRHTAASRYLAGTRQAQVFIEMMLSENWPSAVHLAEALTKWPCSIEHNQTAYQIAHGTDLGIFDFFATKPERQKRFVDAMSWYTQSPGFGIEYLVDGYPWDEILDGKVVDVGGSTGKVCSALAYKYPSITFITQDLPDVIDRIHQAEDLPDNFNAMAHDFFKEQPVKDADIYLFRQIMHDWNDYYATNILKNVVSVMRKDAAILINERLLPASGETGRYSENIVRGADLLMLSSLNGKERDKENFRNLFLAVDPRLKISRIFRPEGSTNAILEARLQEE